MDRVILITGISSGFGKEIARLLASRGYRVYGTTRNGPGDISGVNYLHLDLAVPLSVKQAVKQIAEKEGRIDILINNAGMHSGGPAETIPPDYARLQVETSFNGLACVTREVLPFMRNRHNGTIINISSIGGLLGLPYQSFYSAAKFAVEGFSEALRMEVKNSGIRVILVNPGDFRTNCSENRRKYLTPEQESEQFMKTLKVIERDESNGRKPEELAQKILQIIESKNPSNRYIVASFDQKLAVVLKRLLPSKWFDRILMGHYGIK